MCNRFTNVQTQVSDSLSDHPGGYHLHGDRRDKGTDPGLFGGPLVQGPSIRGPVDSSEHGTGTSLFVGSLSWDRLHRDSDDSRRVNTWIGLIGVVSGVWSFSLGFNNWMLHVRVLASDSLSGHSGGVRTISKRW